jgi:hypothetical protein
MGDAAADPILRAVDVTTATVAIDVLSIDKSYACVYHLNNAAGSDVAVGL